MTDVLLFQTLDDGDVTDQLTTTEGLETAVYLSLFGGNENDDGQPDNPLAYWANVNADEENERQVSRLQNLLIGLPATTGNLKRLNDAALADLAWLNGVTVSATIPQLNRVQFTVNVNSQEFTFNEGWAIA